MRRIYASWMAASVHGAGIDKGTSLGGWENL